MSVQKKKYFIVIDHATRRAPRITTQVKRFKKNPTRYRVHGPYYLDQARMYTNEYP